MSGGHDIIYGLDGNDVINGVADHDWLKGDAVLDRVIGARGWTLSVADVDRV